ncbi:MAG: MaoC family dehydratase N-terminal domain-containing protein [Acidimicrobiia bacterium]|nr:MaoC family dehydratase N-terminal domain-containing protein [Acidimicrobiia bacterium]
MSASEQAETLVSDDMVERKGVWSEARVSPPIAESDIRRWAIAVHWPETPPAVFWDSDYAAGTRWGSIIAPPDFNPFAWPIRAAREAKADKPAKSKGPKLRGMNGGQVETYGVPMKPGDVISARNRLRDWEERDTRLGRTLFVYSETEWRNQDDELVKTRVSTAIRY